MSTTLESWLYTVDQRCPDSQSESVLWQKEQRQSASMLGKMNSGGKQHEWKSNSSEVRELQKADGQFSTTIVSAMCFFSGAAGKYPDA